MAIWAAATAITAALAMGILLFDLEFVTFFGAEELLAELSFGDMRLVDYAGHAALLCIEVILLMIAAEACLCLQMYAAMAVGHSFTHHKGLLSFAAYLVLCIAWNLVQSAAMHVLGVITPEGIQLELNISAFAATHITLWSLILCSLIPSSIWYVITTYFLKNRLNLD